MDFSDTAEEAAFRDELRRWIADQLPFPPLPEDDDQRMERLNEWQHRVFDGGWAAVSFPEAYGGHGLGPVYEAIVLDELGIGRAAVGVALRLHRPGHPACTAPKRNASGSCRRPSVVTTGGAKGSASPTPAPTWRRSPPGPNGSATSTSITGQKVWTSEAHWADWCLLLARSEPDAPNHQAMSCFVVPMTTPGLTVRPFRQMTGSLEFAEVFFDDVRIPADHRVGEAGDGWRIAMSTVSFERGPADVGFLADLRRAWHR